MEASPGHKFIFGLGDAKTWNVGGDADVEDFDLEAHTHLAPTCRLVGVGILNLPVQHRAAPKLDAWHFAKSDNTCKIFGTVIVDAVSACHGDF